MTPEVVPFSQIVAGDEIRFTMNGRWHRITSARPDGPTGIEIEYDGEPGATYRADAAVQVRREDEA